MIRETPIRAINERLATKVRREGKTNPDSPYANRFVGLASGKVVVIADSLTEVSKRLRKIEPDPSNCYVVDVAANYDRPHEV